MPKDRKASPVGPETDLSALGPDEAREFLAVAIAPDPSSGILSLSAQRAVIVRPEVIVNIQKQLEQTIGGSSKGIMYLAGERSAVSGLNPLQPITTDPKGEVTPDHAKRVMDTTAILGWGRTEILEFDPDAGRFVLSLMNSPIASAYGPAKKPVCHFIAGWTAGVGRMLLGKDFLCEETGCAAQGRERCEFELRPMPS